MKLNNYKNFFFHLSLVFSSVALAQPTVNTKQFFDLTYHVTDNDNHFAMGQYDHFVNAQLSDKISFIGEAVFEYDGEFAVDVERAIMQYEVKNYLKLSFGKIHTPIGYFNNAYHHGTVLQPTIERPDPFLFEDDGGLMPIHNVGIMISGDNISKFKLGYNLMLSNGMDGNAKSDRNTQKSICGAINFPLYKDLKIYLSGYYDYFSPGAATMMMNDTLMHSMNQYLANASLVYMVPNKSLEFMTEYVMANNKIDMYENKTTHLITAYVGYNIKKVTPYLRYDQIMFTNGEQYYMKNNSQKFVVGVRYNFNYLAVMKMEYQHSETEMSKATDKLVLQFAIGF